jgi:hypothetical protein
MMRDFILRGTLEARYGSSTLYRPAGSQKARPASPGRGP